MLIPLLVWGILLPVAITLVATALGRPWREPDKLARVVLGPAVALGVVVAYTGMSGAPALLPLDAPDRLPHIAVLAALVAVAEVFLTVPMVREGMRVVVALIAADLLVRPLMATPLGASGVLAIAGAGLGLAAYTHFVSRSVAGESPRVGGALATLLAGSMAVAILSSGSMKLGQLGGALAAGCGVLFAALVVFPRASRLDSVVTVVGVTAGSVGIAGAFYSELPTSAFLILAALPPVYVAVRALFGARLTGSRAIAIRLAIAGMLAAIAVGLAAMPAPSDTQDSEYDYGYGYE